MKVVLPLAGLLVLAGAVTCVGLGLNRSRLQTQLAQASAEAVAQQHALSTAEQVAGKVSDQLTASVAELAESRSLLSAVEVKSRDLVRELAEARAERESAEERARRHESDASALREAWALAQLEVTQAGADQIAAYEAIIGELENQLAGLTMNEESNEVSSSQPTVRPVAPIPVLSVAPGNAFVVLGFGSADGARPDQILAITHGTETVASVLITDVHLRHAVAQVRPDTLQAGLHIGDAATIDLTP